MKLISCENCGVVIDTDRIDVPEIEDEEGVIIDEKSVWRYDEPVPAITCPCCKEKIAYSDGSAA